MRRSWLALVIVASGMVGIGVGSVAAYEAFTDEPAAKTAVHVYLPPTPAPTAAPVQGSPSPSSAPGSTSTDVPVAPPTAPPGHTLTPVDEITGVLSEDFRKLGLDDPTTTIDESVKSACETGRAIAGPALCR